MLRPRNRQNDVQRKPGTLERRHPAPPMKKPSLFFTLIRRASAQFPKYTSVVLAFVAALVLFYVFLPYSTAYQPVFFSPFSRSNTTDPSPNTRTTFLTDGKPPRVDRSILAKLEELQTEEDPRYVGLAFPSNNDSWPPLVTRIPEPQARHTGSGQDDTALDAEVDLQTCGVSSCLFLLPSRIGEQESKARQHLAQVFQLALSLNRTFVLPNVGKSRLGSCQKWDFETYYRTQELLGGKEEQGRLRIVSMDAFKHWISARRTRPNGQLISVDAHEESFLAVQTGSVKSSPLVSKPDLLVELSDEITTRKKHGPCLKSKFKRLALGSYAPLAVHLPSVIPSASDSLGLLLARVLSSPDASQIQLRPNGRKKRGEYSALPPPPDVLILDWDLRHLIFSDPSNPDLTLDLAYSARLSSLSSELTRSLEPYLAIHWRLETVPSSGLSRCALSLISTLRSVLASSPEIKNVWFASDYPYPISSSPGFHSTIGSNGRRSGTFKVIAPEHVEAIDTLKRAFEPGGALERWRITGLHEAITRLHKSDPERYLAGVDEQLLKDAGVLGILDKLIAMNASAFVSGAKGCGRVSSFTAQIVAARRESKHVNVVEYFGL